MPQRALSCAATASGIAAGVRSRRRLAVDVVGEALDRIDARDGDLATRDAMKREAQRAGKGIVFDSHDHALQWLASKVEKFNTSPHSALPRIADPMTGKRRHQTPAEALQAARDAGWVPVLMDEAHIVDLFRPHVRKTVRRGTVSPYGGQRYYQIGRASCRERV